MSIIIGENIKKLRKQRNITQEILAEHLAVTPQAISRWESGVGYPAIDYLPDLAGFFGIAAVLGIWAAVDFDGLFVTFHRVAFPQGGWLLDPRTDLLIRLMPVSFFIRLGVIGLLRFGLFATATLLGLWGLRKRVMRV